MENLLWITCYGLLASGLLASGLLAMDSLLWVIMICVVISQLASLYQLYY